MPVSVTMPRLGESVSEGTVTRWLKQEGEQVQADEPLLEVSTDKVDTEIPAPASGVLRDIKVSEDETVEVGVELATIDDGGGGGGEAASAQEAPQQEEQPQQQAPAQQEAPAQQSAQPEPEPEPAPAPQPEPATAQEPARQADSELVPAPTPAPAPAPQPAQAQQPAQASQRAAAQSASAPQPAQGRPQQSEVAEASATYVTPLVRKLASEHGVDLDTVSGTGVGGRIRKQDVLDAARTRAPEPAPAPASAPAQPPAAGAPAAATAGQVRGRTEKMSRMRGVIAQRMHESLQSSAQLTTVLEVDVTAVARLRQQAKDDFARREGVRLSFLPFFAMATTEALKAHPKVNASIDVERGEITYHDAEHLGIAVDTERGLMVPVVQNAGDLNLGGLARKIADVAERTRTGQVSPDELGGGTFTLTNTGSRGALFDTPIINQPQVGILGTGSVVKRPVVVDDPDLGEVITVRSMVYLALTYDHRLVDGADAARFLVTIKDRLEEGRFEGELGL